MSLLFADSFDHYTTFPNVKGWTDGAIGGATIATGGRNGTKALSCGDVRKGGVQAVPGNPATVFVGASIKLTGGLNGGASLFSLRDGSTVQVDVRTGTLGECVVTRNGTTLATSAAGLFVIGSEDYWEVKLTVDPAAGVVVVKKNGAVIHNLTGINTRASAASQVTNVVLAGINNGITGMGAFFDDFYICDSAGAVNNTFLGDVRIQAIVPDGAGNYTEWDGLTGAATHWQAQNENPPTDDTTYVSDTLATPGHRDTYTLGNVTPTSGTVPAIQVSAWARKDDAGVRTLATMVRSGAADSTGANVNLGTTYGYVSQIYETDPAAAAWTIAKANALEAGVKAVA